MRSQKWHMQAVEEDGLPGFLIGIYLMNLAHSNAMHCCILDTHSKELCFVSQAKLGIFFYFIRFED